MPQAEQDERYGKYRTFIGKRVMISYTCFDQFENVTLQEQATGRVAGASLIAAKVEDDEYKDDEVIEAPPVLWNSIWYQQKKDAIRFR